MAKRRTMLTVTEELWMTVVRTRPINVAMTGLCSDPIRFTTCGSSFMPAMELDMVLSPRNRMPKPMMMSANFFTFSCLQNMATSTPASRKTGAYADRLKDTSWEVTVVPMLAPKMTPAA